MSLKCPRCGGELLHFEGERLKCSGCHVVVKRKERSAATVSQPAPGPADGAAVHAHPQRENPKAARSMRWIAIGGATALAVVVAVAIASLKGTSGSAKGPAGSTAQPGVDASPGSKGDSEAERRRLRADRLKAMASLTTDDDPAPAGLNVFNETPLRPASNIAPPSTAETADPSPTNPPTQPPASSAAPRSAPQAAWSVTAAAEQHPTIDGIPTRPSDGAWPEGTWILVVPPGRHVVQMSANEAPRLVDAGAGFTEYYRNDAAAYRKNDAYDFEALMQATLKVAGVFHDPLLPHHWGNYFWQINDRAAAIRMWQEAVRVDAAFAPSHLNLAHASIEEGNHDRAKPEVQLADLLNVQDAYGISDHLRELKRRLGTPLLESRSARLLPASDEEHGGSLTPEQIRVVRVLTTIADICIDPAERIRATNNVGVYLTHEKQPRLGLKHFRLALEEVYRLGGSSSTGELRRHLLGNIERATRDAGMGEHVIYSRLKDLP